MNFFWKRNLSCLFSLVLLAVFFSQQTAVASTEFQKEFIKLYAKGKDVDKDYKKLVRKAKCYLCHQGKDDRKNCNIYGIALAEYLTEKDEKDKEKIIASIKLVAEKPSDPAAEESPTFGDLIAQGKLPGGPLADSKIEPPKTEGEEEDTSEEKPENKEESANSEADDAVPES